VVYPGWWRGWYTPGGYQGGIYQGRKEAFGQSYALLSEEKRGLWAELCPSLKGEREAFGQSYALPSRRKRGLWAELCPSLKGRREASGQSAVPAWCVVVNSAQRSLPRREEDNSAQRPLFLLKREDNSVQRPPFFLKEEA